MMKPYNRICPFCRQMNKDLYLDETGGFMECQRCMEISFVRYPTDVGTEGVAGRMPGGMGSFIPEGLTAAAGFGKAV